MIDLETELKHVIAEWCNKKGCSACIHYENGDSCYATQLQNRIYRLEAGE